MTPSGAGAEACERGPPLPISFVVHGGPQGSFNNSWSYRWNPRLFAAPGYAVVSVDFHGIEGYGQAFTDAITRIGAAGRSRTCRRASLMPPRTTRSFRRTTPARSAAPTAAT